MNAREEARMSAATREAIPPFTVIEEVAPQVDGGRFAVKRVVGEDVVVTAACYAHGHERVACALRLNATTTTAASTAKTREMNRGRTKSPGR